MLGLSCDHVLLRPQVDKSTGTSGDVCDLGTEAAPFQMHPGKAPRKGLKLAKVPAAEIPQKKESR